jgi:hypothetical protein
LEEVEVAAQQGRLLPHRWMKLMVQQKVER